ncbi:MAG TPA: class I SAM-dependent methyltransferase [Candidatus Saccharimonadia bacterium]|jgi:SAM-dependent methyltransferase|nr:class I SAM-dependent methyltransferase [Candidatus Saccharimonadia bacterium]
MPAYAEFSDPRLVAVYDTVCPLGDEKDFYLSLAAKVSARTVIDLGCGTGLLTWEFARRGYHMIGAEPAALMLEAAKRRFGDHPAEWIHGSATALGRHDADMAFMSGHVAQFFLEDAEWQAALSHLHAAVKPGGILAFESRNPDAPLFPGWPTAAAPERLHDPQAGPIEWWSHNLQRHGSRVRYEIHYRFPKTGEEIVSHNELIFRSRAEITQSLEDAGFAVQHVYGGWDETPATATSPEMIFVASRPEASGA